MDTKYNWNNLLFMADMLVQGGSLSEEQLILIIDLVDKTVVKK